MQKIVAVLFASLCLIFGSMPMLLSPPLNVLAAETDPNVEALNSYLQGQQQKSAQQKLRVAEQQSTANNTQNTKTVWPWWAKLFSATMMFNAVLSFFALIFALAALWKWLALKK